MTGPSGTKTFMRDLTKGLLLDSAKGIAKLILQLLVFSVLVPATIAAWNMIQGASLPEAFNLALGMFVVVWAIILLAWLTTLVVLRTCGFGGQDAGGLTSHQKTGALPRQDAEEVETLLGAWNVVVMGGEQQVRETWTFASDHKMIDVDGRMCGRWEMTQTEVLITWSSYQRAPHNDENCWETFSRPLDRFGVTGKSWQPDAEVRANKVGALSPSLRAAQSEADGDESVFIGLWQLGVNSDSPDTFIAELRPDYTAERRQTRVVPAATGSWEYRSGRACIRWDDGWTDTLSVTKSGRAQNGLDHTASAVKLRSQDT